MMKHLEFRVNGLLPMIFYTQAELREGMNTLRDGDRFTVCLFCDDRQVWNGEYEALPSMMVEVIYESVPLEDLASLMP